MCKIHSKTTKIFEENKNSDFQFMGVILKAHDTLNQIIILKTISGIKTFELEYKTSEKYAKLTQNDLRCCVVFA